MHIRALPTAARRLVFGPASQRFALALSLGTGLIAALPNAAARADVVPCTGGEVQPQPIRSGGGDAAGQQPDLLITGACRIEKPAQYFYGNVNIVGPNGSLTFKEPAADDSRVQFWATSIIVEKDGALIAGDAEPYGKRGGILTILIYGADQSADKDPALNPGQGALCALKADDTSNLGPCGIPLAQWDDNGKSLQSLPGAVTDYFYQYGPLYGDHKCSDGSLWKNGKCGAGTNPKAEVGYFGYKTLAVSYGGTLVLNGYKGTPVTGTHPPRTSPGLSWLRLAADLNAGDTTLTLSEAPGDKWWRPKDINPYDRIVVTSTDYMPGHSEEFIVTKIDGATVTFQQKSTDPSGAEWFHSGTRYQIESKLGTAKSRMLAGGMDPKLISEGAETRAAVALLSRSIRIISAGDTPGQTYAQAGQDPNNCLHGAKPPFCYKFGAHTVFRQGFKKIQIRGVEFENLGQGGKKGHYSVHFHKARLVPGSTLIADSVFNKSNTRWVAVHSTQGVDLVRNIGYKSIGHGFFLEDGTETDNRFFSNIGILARAAVEDDLNPQRVPGILSDPSTDRGQDYFPFFSDYNHPTTFWISNGWNDFIGNMAVGAGTCGACYWLVPSLNSDTPDVERPDGLNVDASDTGRHMKWYRDAGQKLRGYASLQRSSAFDGATPLKSFYKNFCSSAMNSFITVGNTAACHGVVPAADPRSSNVLKAVDSFAPRAKEVPGYYPKVTGGGARHGTYCPNGADGKPDCSSLLYPCSTGNLENCAVTVLDHYTSSFHWAESNLSAIWLRNQWYLLDNSFLSDVQNGGLTFITGGDYTTSSVIPGYWALAKSSVFVGHSQPQDAAHGYANDAGPFNALTKLQCGWQSGKLAPSPYCLSKADGISMPLTPNFAVNQRLFNIYDGPAYQDGNAYLDITKTTCPITGAGTAAGCMYGTGLLGVRKEPATGSCYLPNAAVAWKQPNGFFYPPAFHSANLYFNTVDIRHYVINPLFRVPDGVPANLDFHQGGTYLTDFELAKAHYCTNAPNMFIDFSGIDRQTELNDDDGSMTGLTNDAGTGTISVNEDPFFNAPVETAQCRSNLAIDSSKACPTRPVPIAQQLQTAKTSPYDYVATAIMPQCSQGPSPSGRYGRCGDSPGDGSGGNRWSGDCTNGLCYGVPLYRQFLTGTKGTGPADSNREWRNWLAADCFGAASKTKPQCRWPFMRMAGQNIYQRETLTANHGTYFLDTSVPLTTQRTENFTDKPGTRNVNVFEPGQTYYLYFLYAKPTTRQTYQIYVGTGFNVATGLKAVRGSLNGGGPNSASVYFTDYKNAADQPEPKPAWLKLGASPVDANGVLTLTIDFDGLTELNPTVKNMCKPSSFCTEEKVSGVGTGKCTTSLTADNPAVIANPDLLNEAKRTCSKWAMKDLDCPEKGCLGVAFSLPNDGSFKYDVGQSVRPGPLPFPTTPDTGKPDWLARFVRTATPPDKSPPSPDYKASSCYYPDPLPGTLNCPVK